MSIWRHICFAMTSLIAQCSFKIVKVSQHQQIHGNLFWKSRKRFKRFPEIPFWFNLRSKSSCHTLSKALDISKKTPLTSNPSSNHLYISWVITSNWLRVPRPKSWLIWRDQIVLIKKGKHFVINETLKNFAANRE